jgi:phenylalanyl-tRNA synthetase beta chain
LLKDFDIDQECFYAEIELEFAQELRSKNELKFKDIPKFNKIRRDLALLIDKSELQDLYQTAKKNKSPFIKNINLFDVYEGKIFRKAKILRNEL